MSELDILLEEHKQERKEMREANKLHISDVLREIVVAGLIALMFYPFN